MVTLLASAGKLVSRLALCLLAADEPAPSLLYRLDPQKRAQVLMALLGLVLTGVALMALAFLGGRRGRIIADGRGPTPRREDDWFRKPLSPPADDTEPGPD